MARDTAARRRAAQDLGRGLARYPLWLALGWQQVRQRYRRSALGPFWITLSMGVFIGALGLVYGRLFGRPSAEYLPFLAAGFLVWGFISSNVLDGSRVFLAAAGTIRQLDAPLSTYVYQLIWVNFVVFLHNMWIYIAIAFWFQVDAGATLLWVLPGMALLTLNVLWMVLLFGTVSARFPDVPLILQNTLQLLFFLTPIIWRPDMLPGRTLLLDGNPLFHLVQVVRQPMLGEAPSLEHWAASLGLLACGWACAFLVFAAYRGRIAYWV